MDKLEPIVIIGCGVFGVTTAIELKKRGYSHVTIIDEYVREGKGYPHGKPHPAAASNDISKVVRSDYGKNLIYTKMNDMAIEKWKELNKKWGEEIYHEAGILMALQEDMKEGELAQDTFETLTKFNYPIRKLTPKDMEEKFKKFSKRFKYGYFNEKGGWTESGVALEKFIQEAEHIGVDFVRAKVEKILYIHDKNNKMRANGVRLTSGREVRCSLLIVAAGSWTPLLVPHLQDTFTPTAQVVFHFQPDEKTLNEWKSQPVFFADPQNLGFYGFPTHPKEQVIKIAFHSAGYPFEKGEYFDKQVLEQKLKKVSPHEEKRFRKFFEEFLPDLKDATVVLSRLCMYCDTFDGNFLFDHDPNIAGLFVATGGSGHGLKFAPILGSVIADAFERKPNEFLSLFKWRKPSEKDKQFDVARFVERDAHKSHVKSKLAKL